MKLNSFACDRAARYSQFARLMHWFVLYTSTSDKWSNSRSGKKAYFSFVKRWILEYYRGKKGESETEQKHTNAPTHTNIDAFLLLLSFPLNPLVRYSFHFNAQPQHTSVNDADYLDPIKMSTLLWVHAARLSDYSSNSRRVFYISFGSVRNRWIRIKGERERE